MKGRTGFEESRDFPIRLHDIIAGRYEVIEYLGSAAFSRVVQCLDHKNGQMVFSFSSLVSCLLFFRVFHSFVFFL